MLEPRRADHRRRNPAARRAPRSTYRKVRDRASYAFALVSVAAELDVDDGTVARRPRRARRRGPQAVARPRRRAGAARRTGDRATCSARPPTPNWRPRNRCRATSSRSSWPARTIVAALRDLTRGTDDDRQQPPRSIGAPLDRVDGPPRSPAPRPTPTSTTSTTRRTCTRCRPRSRAGPSRSIDTAAAGARRRGRGAHRLDAPRLRERPTASSRPADTEVHYRGQSIGAVIAESPKPPGRQRHWPRVVVRRATPTTAEFRGRPPAVLRNPSKVNGGFPTLDRRATSTPRWRGGRRRHRRQRRTPPREHNNPMEPHAVVAPLGRRGPQLTLYDSTQGVHAVARRWRRRSGCDRAGARRRAERRRRVRVQGRAARAQRARRHGRAACPGGP